MDAAPRTADHRPRGHLRPYPSPLVADRTVDLLRVSSALCTGRGRGRRLG